MARNKPIKITILGDAKKATATIAQTSRALTVLGKAGKGLAKVAAERGVPVIGNGDILTPYEARERMARSGVRSVMLGRGALIKPWLFTEIKERRCGAKSNNNT